MANECAGLWKSTQTFLVKNGVTVPNPVATDDLKILIEPHDSTTFTGWYLSNPPIPLENTSCVIQVDRRHIVSFTRNIDENFRARYIGRILNRHIIGEFIIESRRGGPDDGDTGTWGATKPI